MRKLGKRPGGKIIKLKTKRPTKRGRRFLKIVEALGLKPFHGEEGTRPPIIFPGKPERS